MKVTYRNGLPSKSFINKVLDEKYPKCTVNNLNSYTGTCNICWQRENINDDMLNFKEYLISLGINVTEYSPYKYMSGRVGFIKIERIKK